MSYPITGQYNQQPPKSRLDPNATPFIPRESLLNGTSVRHTSPTFSLQSGMTKGSKHKSGFPQSVAITQGATVLFDSTKPSPPVDPKKLLPNSSCMQAKREQQNPNSQLDSNVLASNPNNLQPNSASMQDKLEEKYHNSWKTPTKAALISKGSKLNDAYDQPTTSIESSNIQHPSIIFDDKTPSELGTNIVVNNFIKNINDLYYSRRININKFITAIFNDLKRNANCLNDNHRKQILNVIPKINEIIDKVNLDSSPLIIILGSLAKTKVCYELNPKNTLIDKILNNLQIYTNYKENDWSALFYSQCIIAEQSLELIDTEHTNNLIIKFYNNIKQENLTISKPQNIDSILLSIVKFLKIGKLDKKSIVTQSVVKYLLQKTMSNVNGATPKFIGNSIYSISRLVEFPEFRQIISDNKNIIVLLLQELITNKFFQIGFINFDIIFYGLGLLSDNIYWHKKNTDAIKTLYNFFLEQIGTKVLEINIQHSNAIISGIIRLMSSNIITNNKPSKKFIRDILLNKIIANPSIINNKELYLYIYTISFFQEYLTKIELIRILQNITFFIPYVSHVTVYFASIGPLLARVYKELYNDNKNEKLLILNDKIRENIKAVWDYFKPYVKNFNQPAITAIHNTCSLIYEQTELTSLEVNYENTQTSPLENICIYIIKTLIPNYIKFNREYVADNIPPIDACLIYPDGGRVAIEIQGPGHYLDDNCEYPNGKTLLKRARMERKNISVIEVNSTTDTTDSNYYIKIASYLIKLLLENNIEIRPKYYGNIPQLLRDAGITF